MAYISAMAICAMSEGNIVAGGLLYFAGNNGFLCMLFMGAKGHDPVARLKLFVALRRIHGNFYSSPMYIFEISLEVLIYKL